MPNINRFETFLAAANGGKEEVVLTGKSELYDYENGKRGEIRRGTKYHVALQGNRLAPLTVKIEGPDPLPKVSDEQIAAACASMKYAYVRFSDCKVTIYAIDGMVMTATATGVELVQQGTAKQ